VLVGKFDEFDTTLSVIPTYEIPDSAVGWYWSRSVPTDDPYVFQPGTLDSVPRISIGRIPFNSLSQVSQYVDKVIDYEQQGQASWKWNALHAIEDHNLEGAFGSSVATHLDSLVTIYGARESNFNVSTKLGTSYYANYNLLSHETVALWNAGLGFVMVHGTAGNEWNWGPILSRGGRLEGPGPSESDSLFPNHKYPVALVLTCGGTAMAGQNPSGLVLSLLGTAAKGAVSVTGPSRGVRESAGYFIGREWFRAVFTQGGPAFIEPGRVLQQAKAWLMGRLPGYQHEFLSFVELGDPSLQMPVNNVVVGVRPPGDLDASPPLQFQAVGSPGRAVQFAIRARTRGAYLLNLYDVRGRRVWHRSIVEEEPNAWVMVRGDLGVLASGLYFGRLEGQGQRVTSRFVVVR
jgi:hypothetical protein